MRWLPYALLAAATVLGPTVDAGQRRDARRWSLSLRAGGFDEQGRDTMPGGDDASPGTVVGWKGSSQSGLGVGFEVRPGVTLEASLVQLDFDFGSDLLLPAFGEEIVPTQIATGDFDELRLAIWLDARLFGEQPAYYLSSANPSRGRIAAGVLVAHAEAGGVTISDEGRQRLGVTAIEQGSQSAAGFGTRLDYAFGRRRFTVGAELALMWNVGGDLYTVVTDPASPFEGATIRHEGLSFLADVSYRF